MMQTETMPKNGIKPEDDWLDYERFLQLLDEKLSGNAELARPSHGEEIKQAVSKLDPSVDFAKDIPFTNMINEFAKLIQDEKEADLRQLHYRDFIDELRQYSIRRNCDLEKSKLNNKQINDINKKASKIKLEIKMIEKKLADYENREVSMDELDDDKGIYCNKHPKLLQKLKRLLHKLYELQQMPLIGAAHGLRKFRFRGCEHEPLNEAISAMLNTMLTEHYEEKKRTVSKMTTPDFPQVLELVKKVNTQHKLNLHPVEQSARDIFALIGQELKRRRERSFNDALHYYELQCKEERLKLKSLDEDPELQERLRGNDTLKENIESYLEKFADNVLQTEDDNQTEEQEDESLDSESDSETRSEDSLSTLASDTELLQDDSKCAVPSEPSSKDTENLSPETNSKRIAEDNMEVSTKRVKIDSGEEKSEKKPSSSLSDTQMEEMDDQNSDQALDEPQDMHVVDLSSDGNEANDDGVIILLDSD